MNDFVSTQRTLFQEIVSRAAKDNPKFNLLRLEAWSPIGEILKFTLDVAKDSATAEDVLIHSMFSERNRLKPMSYSTLMALESNLKERFIRMRFELEKGLIDNDTFVREIYCLFMRIDNVEKSLNVSNDVVTSTVQAFNSLAPWKNDTFWYEQELSFGLPLMGHDVAAFGELVNKYSFDPLVHYLDWNYQWDYVNCYRAYWCRNPNFTPAMVLGTKLSTVLDAVDSYNPIYARFLLNNNGNSLCLNIN